MKFNYLTILLLVISSTICFAQYTPNCTAITAIYPAPLTNAQINSINSDQQTYYPNVVKLAEPTSAYNCHNYAWVKRDGGGTFWLNTPDDDSFWLDGSYTQVTTNTSDHELRVSYQGDHTAVITGPSSECTSKWGAWGLYRHNINYVPASYLPSATKNFYKKSFVRAMSGPNSFCSTATFSVLNPPTTASITWSVTGTYSISGSNTANPVTVLKSAQGYGTLTANVTTSCGGSYIINKSLTPLAISVTPGGNGYCGEATASFNLPSGSNFYWEVTGDLEINANGQTLNTTDNSIEITGTSGQISVTTSACGTPTTYYYDYQPYARPLSIAVSSIVGSEPLSVVIPGLDYSFDNIYWYIDNDLVETGMGSLFYSSPPCGTHEVRAEVQLSCGSRVTVGSASFERYCGGWWRSMVVYPNPASSYISIAPDAEKLKSLSSTEKSAMKEYEVSLYDIKGKLRLKARSNGHKLNLNTQHLKADNYFLHIRVDGQKEVIKQQVIIKN